MTEYLTFNDPRLSSALVALSELALLSPDVFSKRHKDVIMNFVVKEVITQDRVCVLAFLIFKTIPPTLLCVQKLHGNRMSHVAP